MLAIREAFMPLKQSHMIGRPVEDDGDLREAMSAAALERVKELGGWQS